MVAYSDIKLNNESLSSGGSSPVAVFAGVTGGIGLEGFLALLRHTTPPTVYLVGRGESRLNDLVASSQMLNPNAKLIPIVADDLSLVRNAQKAAELIASQASQIDLLVVSQGFLSFSSKPNWTSEGLDKVTSIRYFSRLRFVITLLPLLRKSPSPRFISVLAGGGEGTLDLEDLGFTKKPENYGLIYAASGAASLTTLAFEELSKQPENEKVVFVHIYPSLVATGLKATDGPLPLRWLFNYALKPIFWLVGYTPQESGERVLFAATNGRFRKLAPGISGEGTLIQEGSDGARGSGVYLVQGDSSTKGGNKALKDLRDQDGGKKVLDFTLSEFDRISKL